MGTILAGAPRTLVTQVSSGEPTTDSQLIRTEMRKHTLAFQVQQQRTQLSCGPQEKSGCHSILSALAPFLMKETVFLLSDYRQASERQELAHDSVCLTVICPEPEVADLVFEFSCLCSLGTGVLAAFLLAVILCSLRSSRVELATLRVC